MTRIGSGAATDATQSPLPRWTKPSSNSPAIARVVSSHIRIELGANALLTNRRRRV